MVAMFGHACCCGVHYSLRLQRLELHSVPGYTDCASCTYGGLEGCMLRD